MALAALLLLVPGDPGTPLRRLWRDAELIVLAKAGPAEGGACSALAPLAIDRVLKGPPDLAKLHVHRAPADASVLAFLHWNPRIEAWTASETRVLPPETLRLYVTRLDDLAAIDRAPKAAREALTVEWLVTCMETPALRWEGAADFASPLSPLPAADATSLSEAQWSRLLASFAAVEDVGPVDYLMADKVLGATPDRRVDDVLVRGLRQAVAAPSPHAGRAAMEILTARRDLPFGRALLADFDALRDDEARRAVLRRFLDRLAT